MYTLIISSIAILLGCLIIVFVLRNRNRKRTINNWLQISFVISFFLCLIVFIYYTHFYMGTSNIIQKLYFGLFYLSILLLITIILTKLINHFKN